MGRRRWYSVPLSGGARHPETRTRRPRGAQPSRSSPAAQAGQGKHSTANGTLDYYDILGVRSDASQDEIAGAYRRQAARHATGWGAQASQRLKLVNAAYTVLGSPARRADYDRLRGLVSEPALLAAGFPPDVIESWKGRSALHKRSAPPRGGGRKLAEMAALLLIAVLGLSVGALVLRQGMQLDISGPLVSAAEAIGVAPRPLPTSAPLAGSLAPSSPVPVQIAPTSTPPPTPTSVPLQTRFDLTTVKVEPPDPPLGTNVRVITRVLRDGEPAPQIPLYLVAYYRTTEERWPRGTDTVRTDERGMAEIAFNIGNATPDHMVRVQVFGDVDGEQVVWQSSYTPRYVPPPPTPTSVPTPTPSAEAADPPPAQATPESGGPPPAQVP